MSELSIILDIFKVHSPKYKFTVNIGATGEDASLDLILKYNWSGVLFEPHPISFKELKRKFSDRPDIRIINKAISNTTGSLPFYLHPMKSLSSLGKNTTWYKEDEKYARIDIIVVNLGTELQRLRIPNNFDFLKVDAEAFDYVILEDMFKNSEYRPYVIMHEIQAPGPEKFKELLALYGYVCVYDGPNNMIYRRE